MPQETVRPQVFNAGQNEGRDDSVNTVGKADDTFAFIVTMAKT